MNDLIIPARFIQTPSGARLRTAVFEAPNGGANQNLCVLLHGQTEFIEKYGEVIAELQARGYAVATFDWRGQGASSRPLANPLKAHVHDFSEYDEDLASFLDQIVRPLGSANVLALAHSMGAHNLIRALHNGSQRFFAAVLSAPMIAISTRGQPAIVATTATSFMNAIGRSQSWVLGMEGRDPLKMRFEDNLVTSDRIRFQRAQDILHKHPEIRLSGPTWGWLKAASASMAAMQQRGYAEAIQTPILICGAGRDRICLTAESRKFAARLPHGQFVEFEDAEHEILMENDSIRTRFWSAFDSFVAKAVVKT